MSAVKFLVRLIAAPVLFLSAAFVLAMAMAIFLVAFAAPASAQLFNSMYPRPLTAYTIYATGVSTTYGVSIGARFGVSPSAGGYAIVRLVSPLSFYFNFSISRPAGIGANLSSYFLPANTVGEYRVPWGQWLAVITPTILNSEAGRATITITEME
mgnify:CR=1 FL=1